VNPRFAIGIVAAALLAGCVTSSAVQCADSRICPSETACDEAHKLCVNPDQLTACKGLADAAPCTAGQITGLCQDGVCLATVCGDGVVEQGEVCDDGNTSDGDGCSQTCMSTETCGNNVVDVVNGEDCDDGNHLDHDGCSSNCRTETPHWIEHSMFPPARYASAIAYDFRRGRTVMFGGINTTGTIFFDTWEWNGGEWLRAPVNAGPQGRAGAGFAYDAALGKSVLFGGSIGFAYYSDTWVWDGTSWVPLSVAGPSARLGHVMVYDAKRQRVVLFGGYGFAGAGPGNLTVFNDTWEFDGSAWRQITTAHSPSTRISPAATYDPRRGVVVLAGGTDAPSSGTTLPDTWEYDGTDWTNVTPASGPHPTVSQAAMAYDVAGQREILYGGLSGTTPQATTWAWNGTAWSNVTTGTPTARTWSGLAQTDGGLVLFGGLNGTTPYNETWTFAAGAWKQGKDPGSRASFGMADDLLRARGVLYGGLIDPAQTRAGDTWDLGPQGFALRANAPPTARATTCMAYDRTRDEFVMFGGSLAGPTLNGETWTWSGNGWTQRTPAKSPTARVEAACAWDGHDVILVGGNIGGTAQGDAWRWDGTTWTQLTDFPVATADVRRDAAAGYDPIRKQLVVFGGIGAIAPTDTTIIYDGTTWSVPDLDFRPPPRTGATLTWNPARQTLVLVGGLGGGFDTADSFEWDGARWRTIPAVDPLPGRFDQGAMTAIDGAGILIYGGNATATFNPVGDRWELRWDAAAPSERCDGSDLDGDGLVGCADPDCWRVCAPLCPPGTTCDPSAQKCGDGTCDAGPETCRTCPADCGACTAACGDGICDPGETGCPGDCP
jgi:cysteine-rich repeat protein